MGKRKVPQKNTLAQWAGVEAHKTTILTFKVDAEKLRALCRPRALQSIHNGPNTEIDDEIASKVSESISSDGSHKSADELPAKAPAEPHPFFVRKKKQAVLVASSDGDISQLKPEAKQQEEPHAFFRPRQTSSKTNKNDGELNMASQTRLVAPLMPCRDTMHVQPSCPNHNVQDPYPKMSVLGKRKRTSRHAHSVKDQQDDPCWAELVHMCCHEAPQLHKSNGSLKSNSSRPLARVFGKENCPTAISKLHRHGIGDELDSISEPGSLWTARYAPHLEQDVLTDTSEPAILKEWLKSRRLHMKDRLQFATKKSSSFHKYPDEYDDFIIDDAPQTSDIGMEFEQDREVPVALQGRDLLQKSNLVILSGPTGCGKSATIQAIAEELHYEIFEVNATDRRSSKDVLEHVGEASQSQMVNKQRSADGTQSKSLLLFEEVDILYRDDKDFWTAVVSLASTSKRPVILTCNDTTVLPPQLDMPGLVLHFKRPKEALAVDYLMQMCALEGADVHETVIREQLNAHKGDLRATINSLQFLALSGASSQSEPNLQEGLLNQEVMSRQMSVTNLYTPIKKHQDHVSRKNKKLFQEYMIAVETYSLVDLLSCQQRSLALEQAEVFENENDEIQARMIEKDDLVGASIISEPQGRFTRLHPGDVDMAISVAIQLAKSWSASMTRNDPVWTIQCAHLDLVSIHQLKQDEEDKMWTTMVEACDSFAVPENWMQDYAPHNSIDRARSSGILSAQVLPHLRDMARTEDEREEIERSALANHTGRTTRNTMSNEFGIAWRASAKIPSALRKELLATRLART